MDATSRLRQKLVVLGPCFDERAGGWETLTLYVSSDFAQMMQERAFLDRFVFPALRIRALERRLNLHWHEHSRFGTRFVSENLSKRIHDLDQCRIRTCDSEVPTAARTLRPASLCILPLGSGPAAALRGHVLCCSGDALFRLLLHCGTPHLQARLGLQRAVRAWC